MAMGGQNATPTSRRHRRLVQQDEAADHRYQQRDRPEPGEQEERHHDKDQVKKEDGEAEETEHLDQHEHNSQMRSSAVRCQPD